MDGKDYWLCIAYEPALDTYFMFIRLQTQKSFLNIIEYTSILAYMFEDAYLSREELFSYATSS